MTNRSEIQIRADYLTALLLSDEALTERQHDAIVRSLDADGNELLWETVMARYCASWSPADHPASSDPAFIAKMWRKIVAKLNLDQNSIPAMKIEKISMPRWIRVALFDGAGEFVYSAILTGNSVSEFEFSHGGFNYTIKERDAAIES
jgi:hypothetical protein